MSCPYGEVAIAVDPAVADGMDTACPVLATKIELVYTVLQFYLCCTY
jgi:hypothetical protein